MLGGCFYYGKVEFTLSINLFIFHFSSFPLRLHFFALSPSARFSGH